MKEVIFREAQEFQPKLEEIRRDLHKHPGVGFDLEYTVEKVLTELAAMGIEGVRCGKAGVTALIGGKKPGKTILLRADMDALPLEEQTDLEYKSQIAGKMHGCGHDLHTAMLLGAAKVLKNHEEEIEGTVKLAFQPAEEIFLGAKDMIENGLLENPKVDAAIMNHVIPGQPIKAGTMMVLADGVGMSSCEQYYIKVSGKGGHGSSPHLAVDPITAAAQIHIALAEINSRELDAAEYGVFTTCKFQAGHTSNVIPAFAEMWGTIRTNDPTGEKGNFIKTRIEEIAKGVGMALRCQVEVKFFDYCPCVIVNPDLSAQMVGYLKEAFGDDMVMKLEKTGVGSEDFAFISLEVPSVTLNFSVGDSREGYIHGVHHPEVRFDDSLMHQGSGAFAYLAMRWLQEQK